MSNKPPKIVVPGFNRGAGIPAGYILGRRRGTGHGPAELLNLTHLAAMGVATTAGVAQANDGFLRVVETANYGPNTQQMLSDPTTENAAFSAGDVNKVSMATMNSGSLSNLQFASFNIDLKGFVGGASFGPIGLFTASPTRCGLVSYGTVTGWEFDKQPYVVANKIFHEGILSFGAGLSYVAGVLTATGGGTNAGGLMWAGLDGQDGDDGMPLPGPPGPAGGAGAGLPEIAFTIPLAANFTLDNGGTGGTLTDKTFGLSVIRAAAGGSQISVARSNTTPSATAFTLTARMTPTYALFQTGYSACIILRNSTNGRLLIFGDYQGGTNILVQGWSSYSAFANNVVGPASAVGAYFPWRRVVLSGGTLDFQCSPDGDIWQSIGTTTVATYLTAAGGGALDQVGFGEFSTGGTLCQSWTVV